MGRENKKKLIYLAGDIMSRGSQLARKEEYELFKDLKDYDIYSPILNKSINDKTAVSEEENNHLAEKIVAADCARLDKADVVVFCPEQNAIGTLCEVGYIAGRKALAEELLDALDVYEPSEYRYDDMMDIIHKTLKQEVYFHYEDIRDTGIKESGWRRSFSINQFLYGCILKLSHRGIETLEEIKEALTN